MPVASNRALEKCKNINLPAVLHGVKDLCSVTWENLAITGSPSYAGWKYPVILKWDSISHMPSLIAWVWPLFKIVTFEMQLVRKALLGTNEKGEAFWERHIPKSESKEIIL